jgi:hypothetical protein
MTYPVIVSTFVDFSSNPIFPTPSSSFTLNSATYGTLNNNYLGSGTSYTVDVSSQVMSINIAGGYQLQQDQFQSNGGTVQIYDPNGWWNPQNTASPYYGFLTVNKKIAIYTQYPDSSAAYDPLFSGYINAYNYSFPTSMSVGYVTLAVSDAFRLFTQSTVATVTGASSVQLSGARINAILDQMGFPASLRNIDTGDIYVQADPGTVRTGLNALKNVEFAEMGAFYIAANGYATFKSRTNVTKTNDAYPYYVFSNDGLGYPGYVGITFANDDKLVVNQCSVTNVGGTAQSYQDADSVAKYFPHTVTQTNVVGNSDTDALNVARLYVAARKTATIRIDNITLDLNTPNYDYGIRYALAMDYFSTIKITNVQTNGSTIQKTLQIMGSSYRITPTNFDIQFITSAPINAGFKLDSNLYGLLDTSNLGW